MRGPTLVCAATARELAAAGGEEPLARPDQGAAGSPGRGNRIFSVTGVGIPMTLARLLPLIALHKPSLLVNIGIAGAYPGSGLAIGDLVAGESEAFGDLGMETPGPESFQPLGTMPWADREYREPLTLVPETFPAIPAKDRLASLAPRRGRGCTVNACAGRKETGELRRRLFGADFETMEGAAVALAGSLLGIPVAEIRAISNFASERDMRPENVSLALGNLEVYLSGWLKDVA